MSVTLLRGSGHCLLRSHLKIMGTYPPNPPSCEEGGNVNGFCERECDGFFNRMMRWLKAIKTAIVFIHQASYAPPFLAGKGAGGIGPLAATAAISMAVRVFR